MRIRVFRNCFAIVTHGLDENICVHNILYSVVNRLPVEKTNIKRCMTTYIVRKYDVYEKIYYALLNLIGAYIEEEKKHKLDF